MVSLERGWLGYLRVCSHFRESKFLAALWVALKLRSREHPCQRQFCLEAAHCLDIEVKTWSGSGIVTAIEGTRMDCIVEENKYSGTMIICAHWPEGSSWH